MILATSLMQTMLPNRIKYLACDRKTRNDALSPALSVTRKTHAEKSEAPGVEVLTSLA